MEKEGWVIHQEAIILLPGDHSQGTRTLKGLPENCSRREEEPESSKGKHGNPEERRGNPVGASISLGGMWSSNLIKQAA